MGIDLLKTKLFVPSLRENLVSRPRLINRLNEGRSHKLTLICAPAGFGKTTLLSDWIHYRNLPVAWVSLDETDNNLNSFLTYLISALQSIQQSIGESILSLLDSTENPPFETLFTILINEISVSEHDFYIVIDDYHLVTRENIYQALDFFLDHLPPNMHLVMSGRVDPPISLSRMRARGQMTEIRLDELRFNQDEGTSFLNDINRLDLSSEDILALIARTEGWVTGLQLAAISMKGREDIQEFVGAFSGSNHYIIDYLVDEVLALQSEETHSFLIQTSVLGRFNASICDAVLEISNSREIIQQLEEANLFVVPLDEEHNWYRYHHLFADVLRQRMREKLPDLIPTLHRRASRWLEENEQFSDAINHALKGDDFDRAGKMIERISPEMMMRNDYDQLGKWLDDMPQGLVEKWPWLCIIRAWMYHTWARLDEAKRYIEFAERALAAGKIQVLSEQVKVIRGQATAIRALIAFNRTRIPEAIEYAHQAMELLPKGHFNRAIAMLALGRAKGANGEFVEANQILVEAYRDSKEVGNLTLTQNILLEKGSHLEKQSRLQEAFETYHEAVQLTYPKTEIKLPHASCASVFMGNISREWNELGAALRYAEEGIEIGLPNKMVDAVAAGYASLARTHLAMGDLESAREAYRKAGEYSRELPGLEPITITQIWDSEARVNFAHKKSDEAVKHFLDNYPCECDLDDINCFGEFEQIIWARILISRGRQNGNESDFLDAQGLIDQMLEMTEDMGLVSKTIELQVLKSMALLEIGDQDNALDALEKALSLAEPGGYLRIFIDEGEPMKALLAETKTRGIAPEYVSKILKAFETDQIHVNSSSRTPLIEPLSDRELEVLRLLKTELSGPEIADELVIALSTMRTHTQSIYSKLGVSNRRAAIRKAKELHLR